jgi:WD40 repeat protein/serine/threonine protein kinase
VEQLNGKSIRGYQLGDLIGVGGFGSVHRAYQTIVDREVAIKIILPEYANQQNFIRNFEREAQLVARLEHPHIVPLYDYWRDPSGAYIVMRWIRGGNLQEMLQKKGGLDIQTVAKILDQIAAALAEAHRNSVIHQDIKAANILLDEQGNAYLTDFGIAKDLTQAKDEREESENEAKTVVHGSPEYMAPEQILNLPVDARTDIYSLGVLLYEMLTGEKPFNAPDDEELVRQQLYERVPSLLLKRPDLSPMYDIVIQRATDKNPKKRYNTPIGMAENFRQFVTVATTPATVEAPTQPVPQTEPEQVFKPINPYKGLRAFQEADAGDFFGREKLIERFYLKMLEPAKEARFLAVVGPSGSGKSSVVRAGLVPMLRKNLPKWFISDMIPGSTPLLQLVEAILKVSADEKFPYESIIQSSVNGLHQSVHQALGAGNSQLVLVIDQFEELFTQVTSEAEREHFIASLLTAIHAEDSRLRVIVTLRADFYDRPLSYPGLSELMSRRTEVVTPLNADDLERVIVKPAERVNLKLEDGLVGAIVADVNKQVGALPLLQFALMELFEKRDKKDTLTLNAYREIGGVTGAMTQQADEIFNKLNEEDQQITEQLFLRLVVPGEGVEDTRRRVLQSELTEMPVDQTRLRRVIDFFGESRLLAFDREATSRIPTIEIAHEALIRNWGRLREWLNQNRDALRLQKQLSDSASQWVRANRDKSFLATGGRLVQLETVRQLPTVVLRPIEQEFLDASMRLRSRNTRRLRAYVTGLTVFSIFTLLLAVFAYYQQGRAERNSLLSRSRELAITALTGSDGLDKALLLGIEAYNSMNTFEARDALLTRIQNAPRLERFLQGNTDAIRAIAYSPDGRLIATGGRDNTVRLWDASTSQPISEAIAFTDDVNTVVFSPDSTSLAAGTSDEKIVIRDAATGEVRAEITADAVVWKLAYSPDGQTLVAALDDGTVRQFDVQTGEAIGEPMVGGRGAVYTVAYSPDGTTIASGGFDNRIRLWNSETGILMGEPLEGHTNWVWSLAFSPDGNTLASGSFDQTVRLWDIETSEEIAVLQQHTGAVRSVEFDGRGRLLVSGGEDGRLILWDSLNRQPLTTIAAEGRVWEATFSPDGNWLVSVSDTQAAQLWNLRTAAVLGTSLNGQTQSVSALSFDTNGILAVGNNIEDPNAVNTVVRWEESGESASNVLFEESQPRLVNALALSADRTTIVTVDMDGVVWFSDALTGERIGEPLQAHDNPIYAVALSADGQTLASGDQNGQIQLWTQAEGSWTKKGSPLGGHIDRVLALAFSPNGQYLASGGRDSIVRLWEVSTGASLGGDLIGHNQPVVSLAFSPDSASFASGGRDNVIVLWNIEGQSIRQTLNGHGNWVNTLAFSPNGTLLASGSRDATVMLWDLSEATVRQLGEPFPMRSGVSSVTFSPDNRQLGFGGSDGAVQVWQISIDAWIETACAIANRNLTSTEWTTYMHDLPYRQTCEKA